VAVFYIETSALLKRYKPESGFEVVDQLIDGRRADETLVTSQLTLVEIHAAMARLRRAGLISERQYDRVLGAVASDLASEGMVMRPLTAS
jgi:predicted nucleic acid-binding protein